MYYAILEYYEMTLHFSSRIDLSKIIHNFKLIQFDLKGITNILLFNIVKCQEDYLHYKSCTSLVLKA